MISAHRFRAILTPCVAILTATAIGASALAEASGPDAFDVTGVRADDTLHMHDRPSARSRTIARIPANARGLKNLGCRGAPTFQQWLAMSEDERKRQARGHWCRVEFAGKSGFVSARYLKEASALEAPAAVTTFGAWRLTCGAPCALTQIAVGTQRRVSLRIERQEGENARIIIERSGLPRRGKFGVYMDGELITEGPIEGIYEATSRRFVLQPDDITVGLIRQMRRHRNMVVSFPGEDRGAEIHLDRFDEAWQALAKARP
ncbi:MAG: hypothetical protein R3D27_08720 [Hyphomicrobiaceae bacterium]